MSTSDRGSIPILVKVWAGSEAHDFRYIKRSLTSLLASDLPKGAHVILVDDQSTHPGALQLLQKLARDDSRVELWRNPERMGPNRGHAYNFPLVVDKFPDARFYVINDDDVIYHPGWLQRVLAVYDEAKQAGLEGVFAALNIPFRESYKEVKLPTSSVLLKQRQMALNWVIPRAVYERVGPFRDVGIAYDSDYTSRMMELGIPVICLKPSYTQNIGYFGAYQNNDKGRALDYVGRRDFYLWSRDMVFGVRRGFEWLKESRPAQASLPLLKRMLGRQ
jgi:glycosyltransferase involved in cell wall biosynthesis